MFVDLASLKSFRRAAASLRLEKRKPGTRAGLFESILRVSVMRLIAGLFRVADDRNDVENFAQSPDQAQDHSDKDRHHDGSEYQTFD